MSQVDKSSNVYEEFKKKMHDQQTSHQDEINAFTERIRILNEKVPTLPLLSTLRSPTVTAPKKNIEKKWAPLKERRMLKPT
jgi:hypothetical protein